MYGMNSRRALSLALALIFFLMLIVTFLYELIEQELNPSIDIWGSHAITIVFTSVITIIIVYFPSGPPILSRRRQWRRYCPSRRLKRN